MKLVLVGIGDGHGDTCDNVSVVRSDNDGRGLRFSATPWSALTVIGFSESSSNTGRSGFALGGVMSKVAVYASRRASLTGDALLGFLDFSLHAKRERID